MPPFNKDKGQVCCSYRTAIILLCLKKYNYSRTFFFFSLFYILKLLQPVKPVSCVASSVLVWYGLIGTLN